MADDLSAAQKILNIKQAMDSREISPEAAQDLVQETGLDTALQQPEQLPPESLQANPPEVPAALQVAQPFVPNMPEITPEMAAASQQAEKNDFLRQNASAIEQIKSGSLNPDAIGWTPEQRQMAMEQGITFPTETPIVQDIPQSQEVSQASEAPVVQNISPQVVEPTPEQHAAAHEKIIAPVQQEIADNRAVKTAADTLQSELLKERQAAEDEQRAVRERMANLDSQARTRSLPEILNNSSFGEKLGAILSVALGAFAQGIGQMKSNPVMDFFDRQADMQAKKDSLNVEQKMALQKNLYELGAQRIQALAQASDDAYKKQHLALQANELQLKAKEIEDNRLFKAMEQIAKQKGVAQQAAFDQGQHVDSLEGISEEQRKRAVRLPNGKYASVNSPADKEKLLSYQESVEPAISGIDRIIALQKNFNRVTDLQQRQKIATEVKLLAGSLRLAVLGPGQMTPAEYERLLDTVGNPTKLATMPSWELAKLKTVQNKIITDRKDAYKRAGIDLPETRMEQMVTNLKAKGYTQDQIDKAIGKLTKGQ